MVQQMLAIWSLAAQSCPTLWDPMDCSSPGSSVHGLLQARILEWVDVPFSITHGSRYMNYKSPGRWFLYYNSYAYYFMHWLQPHFSHGFNTHSVWLYFLHPFFTNFHLSWCQSYHIFSVFWVPPEQGLGGGMCLGWLLTTRSTFSILISSNIFHCRGMSQSSFLN